MPDPRTELRRTGTMKAMRGRCHRKVPPRHTAANQPKDGFSLNTWIFVSCPPGQRMIQIGAMAPYHPTSSSASSLTDMTRPEYHTSIKQTSAPSVDCDLHLGWRCDTRDGKLNIPKGVELLCIVILWPPSDITLVMAIIFKFIDFTSCVVRCCRSSHFVT